MYTQEESYKSSLQYFRGDELAAKKFIEKYCLKDNKGNLLELNPDDMHKRMAKEFARIETKYPNPVRVVEIYELFKDFKYLIPQGSPMYGIGNNYNTVSLSNCFVIDNSHSDSYGGIMLTDQEQVQLMKRRGGVGHDISHLRPAGSYANNSILGELAGAILYMNRYSNSTREVAQDGRRGALMLSISVKHPDSEKFIDVKLEEGKVTGANISVRISDEFMEAVKKGRKFIQTFPTDLSIEWHTPFMESLAEDKIEEGKLYSLEMSDGSYHNCFAKVIDAGKLWNKIVRNAWKSAEPGILFWDTIIRESPADCYAKLGYKTVSTNPCGEIPLSPYDSCRLLAINLYSYVENPFTAKAKFNFKLFKEHVRVAQRLMDDLVDLEIEKIDAIISKIKSDPEPESVKGTELELWNKIRKSAVEARRTGLGVTAEADMIAAIGLKFGTPEATKFSTEVHRVLAKESYISSMIMAKERGCFPIWDIVSEMNNPFVNRVLKEIDNWETDVDSAFYAVHGRRNISNLTIAPTGTTSLMSQTTSGIEPLFLPFYKRRTRTEDPEKATFIDESGDKWQEFNVVHPKFIEWYVVKLKEGYSDFRVWYDGLSYEYDDVKNFLESIEEGLLKILFEHSPYYGATSNDIDWVESIKMQGAVQKWVDHSISKTVNLPKETTVETVGDVYMAAYDNGCKGVTIYRDGSRSGILVQKEKQAKEELFDYSDAYKRPEITECDIYHKTALKQNFTVIVGKVNGKPFEVFTLRALENHEFPLKIKNAVLRKIKSRHYQLEGVLRGKKYVIDNIIDFMADEEKTNTKKISAMLRHGMHPKFIYRDISKFASIVSFDKVIQRALKNYLNDDEMGETCPACGSTNYISHEGCWTCLDCGSTKCG